MNIWWYKICIESEPYNLHQNGTTSLTVPVPTIQLETSSCIFSLISWWWIVSWHRREYFWWVLYGVWWISWLKWFVSIWGVFSVTIFERKGLVSSQSSEIILGRMITQIIIAFTFSKCHSCWGWAIIPHCTWITQKDAWCLYVQPLEAWIKAYQQDFLHGNRFWPELAIWGI